MTSPSPSEFLTFMRHVTVRSSLRPSTIHPRPSIAAGCRIATASSLNNSQVRRVSSTGTGPGVKTEQYPDSTHTTKKHASSDIQAEYAHKGTTAKEAGGTDHATAERDITGSTAKAKKEHPEAPDVVIGMQDERGARGH